LPAPHAFADPCPQGGPVAPRAAGLAPPDSHRRTRTAGQGDFLRRGFLRSEFADFSMERPIVSDLFSRPQGDRFGRRAENAFRKGHRLRLFFVNNLLISLDNIEQDYRVSRGVLRQ
jgi:hypothetical protein